MALCAKCRKFFPPGFVEEEKNLCIFCENDRDRIYYDHGNKLATRDEIVEEYRLYLAKLNESVLKKTKMPNLPDINVLEEIKKAPIL